MNKGGFDFLKNPDSKKLVWQYALLFGISIVVFMPVMWQVIHNAGSQGDFTLHNQFAMQMWQDGVIGLPHFLYHISVMLLSHSIGLSTMTASLILCVVTFALIPPMIRSFLKIVSKSWAVNLLAIGAAIVSPLTVLAFFQHGIYTGYIPLTVYHSPTMILMKPLAFGNFILIIRGIQQRESSKTMYLLSFLSLLLATLAKPNYTMAMLPAVGCFALLRWRIGKWVSWNYLTWSIAIPSLLLLAWQYYFTYASNLSYSVSTESTKIIFAPFAAVTSDSEFVIVKFLSSTIFPIVVTALFWKRLRHYPEYFLSLFIFVSGCLYFYLLAEPGIYLTHKRFLWGASIGLFLWFITCLKILIAEAGLPSVRKKMPIATILCYGIFFLSVLNGVVKCLVDAGYLSRGGMGL